MVAVLAAISLLATGCSPSVLQGHPTLANAPNASLPVHDDTFGPFDTAVKNALSDVFDFWRTEFPVVWKSLHAGTTKGLSPLKGGLFSVDGLQVAQTKQAVGASKNNACIARDPSFIVDNGAYCILDDTIAWDRAPTHLFAQLASKYGTFMVAMIFAHEMGHAISNRLGVFDQGLATYYTESQADCAAGSWVGWALKGNAAHFRDITAAKVDDALQGFLDGRDSTPGTPNDVSHGNGFDRLSAVADGLDHGAPYCFGPNYFRTHAPTERPFSSQADYAAGGNTPLNQVLDTSAGNPFVEDLNRFWAAAAQSIGKKFTPVKIVQATHPKCGAAAQSQFGYCPDDNSVYFDPGFAAKVYNSLPGVEGNGSNGDVTLVDNQPGDFALGVMFSIAWGMAVRHQLFNQPLDDHNALMSAICYTGSYSKDINVAQGRQGQFITLSPADLDEATSAMLNQVGSPQAFGSRGSTGLDRMQAFVGGYRSGLASCNSIGS